MRRIYDWDKWFGRGRFKLRRGIDYHCSQTSMGQQIRNAATHRGLSVRLVETSDGFTVLVSKAEEGVTC